MNKFPKEELYQCFLLDKNNRVVLVGNPLLNPNLWELYKKTINKGNIDQETGERDKAVAAAQTALAKEPKVQSTAVREIRAEMNKLLENIQ